MIFQRRRIGVTLEYGEEGNRTGRHIVLRMNNHSIPASPIHLPLSKEARERVSKKKRK